MTRGLVPHMVICKCCSFLTWQEDWFLPWSDVSAVPFWHGERIGFSHVSAEDVKTYVEDMPTSNKDGSIELPMMSRIER